MNHFAFTGRLTHDPELTTFNSGKKVARFSVAIDRRFQDAAGEWQSDPTFVECEVWEAKAQTLVDRYKKGDFILVTDSSIKTDRWEDKPTGQKRSKLMFRVNHYEPLPKLNPPPGGAAQEAPEGGEACAPVTAATAPAKAAAAKKTPAKKTAAAAAPAPAAEGESITVVGEDDIPF